MWKSKFGGMDVSDAKWLRALEDENAKLKKLLAEAMLDNAILKDVNSRKWWRPLLDGRSWLKPSSADQARASKTMILRTGSSR